MYLWLWARELRLVRLGFPLQVQYEREVACPRTVTQNQNQFCQVVQTQHRRSKMLFIYAAASGGSIASLRVGDKLEVRANKEIRQEPILVQADGDELTKALRIIGRSCTPTRTHIFVGDD